MQIRIESPRQRDVIALIDALDAFQKPLYPPESHYGIDIDALCAPEVVFLVARDAEGQAVACGGVLVQPLDGDCVGELKRMFTRPECRGQGISRRLLARLEQEAAARGATRLLLETGCRQDAAIALYTRMGFQRRGRFGSYPDDPLSIFMEKPIPGPGAGAPTGAEAAAQRPAPPASPSPSPPPAP